MKKAASILFLLITCSAYSQGLKPGFNKAEYASFLKLSTLFSDSSSRSYTADKGYRLLYRSPEIGLDNRWALWQDDAGTLIICIRGTTKKNISWLANFYAAMVPAKGELKLSETETFSYQLAENPQAAVHTGWLVSTGFLAKDILSKIDSCYKKGIRDFYIMGHSQGGAIAYLLTAYLYQLQKQKALPAVIRFKTYCSAAPKPGNLYFAYEYEAMTQGGWAYNVVNAADWVPQTPFSVQTLDDLAEINPFENTGTAIKKQGWPKRWILSYAFKRVTKPGKKAVKRYKKYLGDYVSKEVKKAIPGFEPPQYFNSSDYVRTGTTITLLPDENYYKRFPQDKDKIFVNHRYEPYIYLLKQLDFDKQVEEK